MPKIAYTGKHWSDLAMDIVNKANEIIARYDAQGFNLTLRQLYYQFVAGDRREAWQTRVALEEAGRKQLGLISEHYDDVVSRLESNGDA